MSERLKICIRNIACGFVFFLLLMGVVALAVVIGTNSLQRKIYTISIHDDGSVKEIRTTSLSVAKALEIADIQLGEYDEIDVDTNGTLKPENTNITINRAKKVTLTIGDEEKVVYTLKDSVEEVLIENNIQIATYDYVNTTIENPISSNNNQIVYRPAIPITLSIDGREKVVYSTQNTIGAVLAENGLEVNDSDFVSQKPSDKISLKDAQISIKTAHTVTLKYDGVSKKVSTQAKTVEQLLKENRVRLSSLDKMANGVTVNTRIKENLVVSVIRVTETKLTESITIPYQTLKEKTDSLLKGFSKVLSKGANGQQVDTYTVVMENGKQVSKTKTSSKVTKSPVNAVTLVGTKTYTTFSSAYNLKHAARRVLDVSAVAYNLEGMNNRAPSHPHYGLTANGSKVRAGIIAVDRRVIPIGTKVYVEIVGGKDYGYAIAADVGVSGYTVDLYLNSKSECINFGRRKAKIHILKDQSVDIFQLRGG